MGMFLPRVDGGCSVSRNVQVSRPLFELCGGHVVVFKMNMPQVALVSKLVKNTAKICTFYFFVQNRSVLCSLTRVP